MTCLTHIKHNVGVKIFFVFVFYLVSDKLWLSLQGHPSYDNEFAIRMK